MPRLASLALATAALVAPLCAAPAQHVAAPAPDFRLDKARIGRALEAMVASERAAGASVLIWKDGREAYFGAAGFADREAKRPMARDTLAQIWSMTKPVTGVTLMQLWEQGKFGLDEPLARYLPEFANPMVQDGVDAAGQPVWRPAKRPILIRDILRHTAGFAYGAGPNAADTLFAAADPLGLGHDLAEFGRRIAGVPLLFDPGTEWRYSAAVDVQALLVERLTGVPYEAWVRQHVLDPLGMKETGWTQPEARFARLARAYAQQPDKTLKRVGDEELRRMNFGPRKLTMGGAGLVSSLDDYIRFARMLLNRGTLDGVRILKPSTVRLMSTDQLDPGITQRAWLPSKGSGGFGFDFFVRTAQPKAPEENRGSVGEFFWDGAWTTLFWVDPANRMAVVFFVQTQPFDGTLHHDIREAVYGPDYLGPAGD